MGKVRIGQVKPGPLLYGGSILRRHLAGREAASAVKLPSEFEVCLYQIILKQDFKSLGKAFRSIAVYFAYIFKGVGQIKDI